MKTTANELVKRAADNNPGWSEAELWVTVHNKIAARFSGRETDFSKAFCRPLERARSILRRKYPGLRFACPGLNSSAGYAGSLSGFVFNSVVQILVQTFLGLIPEGGLNRV
jgi:hypothetical protein